MGTSRVHLANVPPFPLPHRLVGACCRRSGTSQGGEGAEARRAEFDDARYGSKWHLCFSRIEADGRRRECRRRRAELPRRCSPPATAVEQC